MKRFLLDTCAFLWIDVDDPALSKHIRELFQNPDHEIYLSAVSAWEIAIKYQLGKLPLPEPFEQFIPLTRKKCGIHFLPIDEASVLSISRLPNLHKDPLDRMLICQAIVHGLTILTPDTKIRQYAVLSEW